MAAVDHQVRGQGFRATKGPHPDAKGVRTPEAAAVGVRHDGPKMPSHDEVEAAIGHANRELRGMDHAIRDGDMEKAREHADAAKIHGDVIHAGRPELATERGTKEFAAYAPAFNADYAVRRALAEGRQKPEPGAIRAAEYDAMTQQFSAGLSAEQRSAVRAYTAHTDRILNTALRGNGGNVDANALLYSGAHADAETHEKRAVQRAGIDHHRRFGYAGEFGTADDFREHGKGGITMAKEIHDLDSAIASHTMDRDAIVYRTISDPSGRFTGALQPGVTFSDHAYVSTSADKNFLTNYYQNSGMSISGRPNQEGDRIDMHIQLRKGQKAAPLAMDAAGYKETESEVLLPRGSKFRVTKVVPASDGQAKQIHVEVIDNG